MTTNRDTQIAAIVDAAKKKHYHVYEEDQDQSKTIMESLFGMFGLDPEDYQSSGPDPKMVRAFEEPHFEKLATLSDASLNDLYDEIIVRETQVGWELISLLRNKEFQKVQLHEYCVFAPLIPDSLTTGEIHNITRSLRLYPQLPKVENYADCDPDTHEKAKALVILMGCVYSLRTEIYTSAGDYSWLPMDELPEGDRISDGALIELVLDQPEDAQQIADIIADRQTADVTLIRAILDNKSKSLSSGII